VTTKTEKERGLLTAGGVLDLIVEAKVSRLEQAKTKAPLEQMMEMARLAKRPDRGSVFFESLSKPSRVNIIAEVKRRSPSKGMIREDFDVKAIVQGYASAGASAISVLAEEDFFGGSLDDLKAARSQTGLPLLRKDFIIDEYQLYESVSAGADAVLLIVAILDSDLLERLISLAKEIGIDTLVEVHTQNEIKRAARAGAQIVGVNNRDLTTFKVDLGTSIELSRLASPEMLLVSESGIANAEDIKRLRQAGYKAFLIGEHFMRATDPGNRLKRLIEDAHALD
jgi:indole-3-glycerol phosphate synthase